MRIKTSGLQTSALITLGRVLIPTSVNYNISRLIALASANPNIFSSCTRGSPSTSHCSTLDRLAHEPTVGDFRALKRHVQKHRLLYEKNVSIIRRKMLAHKEVVESSEIHALLSVTRVREIQQLVVFLLSLHEALAGLYGNGLKPRLRSRRYSVGRLRGLPTLAGRSFDVHEQMVGQAAVVLVGAARTTQRLRPTVRLVDPAAGRSRCSR